MILMTKMQILHLKMNQFFNYKTLNAIMLFFETNSCKRHVVCSKDDISKRSKIPDG